MLFLNPLPNKNKTMPNLIKNLIHFAKPSTWLDCLIGKIARDAQKYEEKNPEIKNNYFRYSHYREYYEFYQYFNRTSYFNEEFNILHPNLFIESGEYPFDYLIP